MANLHQSISKAGLSFDIQNNFGSKEVLLKASKLFQGTNADRLVAIGEFQ